MWKVRTVALVGLLAMGLAVLASHRGTRPDSRIVARASDSPPHAERERGRRAHLHRRVERVERRPSFEVESARAQTREETTAALDALDARIRAAHGFMPGLEEEVLASSLIAPLRERITELEAAGDERELGFLREEARAGACSAGSENYERTYYAALAEALSMNIEFLCEREPP